MAVRAIAGTDGSSKPAHHTRSIEAMAPSTPVAPTPAIVSAAMSVETIPDGADDKQARAIDDARAIVEGEEKTAKEYDTGSMVEKVVEWCTTNRFSLIVLVATTFLATGFFSAMKPARRK